MYDVLIINGNITQYAHRHNIGANGAKLASATIQEDANAISSFAFTIYPNNPCYENINNFSTIVKVYNNNTDNYDFVGRVLKVTPTMDSDGMYYKNVTCESRLAFLCDTIQPYSAETLYEGDASRNGLQEFIDVILANHNAQVGNDKKIYRGEVTVNTFKTTDNVTKGLNYETTWEVITNKLLGSFGGEIALREADGVLYLDYKENIGRTRATKFEVGKNIESQSRDINFDDVVTRLIPLGAKIKTVEVQEDGTEVETETEERLTIASVNNGINYIEDTAAVARYGVIYGVKEWDNVTDALNLKSKGEPFMAESNRVEISDSVSALDLSLLGLAFDEIKVYDSYPVSNKFLGVNDVLKVVKKTTNVIEPYASSFQLGSLAKLLSDSLYNSDIVIKDITGKTSKLETDLKNINKEVYNYVDQRSSRIEQTAEEIRFEVERNTVSKGVYDEFSQLVRNILSIDENGTAMIFQTITESIENVDGKVNTNYAELLKYIRFINGEIILGEDGNAITLTISNDRLSFKQNGVEIAYLSENNLHIGNAVVKEGGTLQLGNFAFVPRADGSLSFIKVGG
jgi:hypothetical protein